MKKILFLLFFFIPLLGISQKEVNVAINWNTVENQALPYWNDAVYNPNYKGVPQYSYKVNLDGPSVIEPTLADIKSKSIDNRYKDRISSSQDFTMEVRYAQARNEYFAFITINTIKETGSQLDLLLSARLNYTTSAVSNNLPRGGGGGKDRSVLADGEVYKIAISQRGVHSMNGAFLQNQLGIDIGNLDINQIQLFGNEGRMLPEENSAERIDDLEEIPIYIMDGNDGSFSSNDEIIFYAQGADEWSIDDDFLEKKENIYSHDNYVFLRLNVENGKRITTAVDIASNTYRQDYLKAEYYGEDRINLLGQSLSHQGSGKLWVADILSGTRQLDLAEKFNLQDAFPNQVGTVKCSFYGRSGTSHKVHLETTNDLIQKPISRVDEDPESIYARNAFFAEQMEIVNGETTLRLIYPETTEDSDGWMDYTQINYRANARYNGSQLYLRDTFSSNSNIGFSVETSSDIFVWDVTNIHNVQQQNLEDVGGRKQWGFVASNESEFVVFDPSNISLSPNAGEKISNQNLHATTNVDMILLYPNIFKDEAERLARHRESESGMNIAMVNVEEVYNEYASGRLDPSAIRDFTRMVYMRNSRLRYLLLFGDGSYDFRYLVTSNADQNFIPAYETDISLDPIEAFPSDDFFGLLDDNEGKNLRGGLDVAIGRLLCRDVDEAKTLVDKIVRYDNSPATLGNWRNKLVFMADDEDGNQHLRDIERVAVDIEENYPVFDQDKIYFDAYEQVTTPGGKRFPDATDAINKAIFKGNLAMVYLGHGGPSGLAQERVLLSDHIKDWSNLNQTPIIVTATCSFTSYDEPSLTSAGELSVLNENGGAIAILSTVRAVFAGQNYLLTQSVHDHIYQRDNGSRQRLGEVMRLAKNSVSDDSNQRKFGTFGDPSMPVGIPKHEVRITKINQADIASFKDTISSLDKVTIDGVVTDYNGTTLNNFNGEVTVTVFDKSIVLTTKGTDSRSSPYDFDLRKNILFKGTATVSDGEFTSTFVIPKDINFDFGMGKISLYASNGIDLDAHGYYDQIAIGGSSTSGVVDDEGPEIELYMNNEEFVFGGITSKDPIMLVKLKDDNGINVVGNGIGHDLTGVLDNNTQNSFILNDFYEAKKDNYTEGTVRYPLNDLENGRHSIKVTAWDIANNFSEAYTEFVVADDLGASLEHVLNYPNPFTTNTQFQFEHNLPPSHLDILIHVFTVSGKLVKTVRHSTFSDGYRVSDIPWNGNDEFEEPLAKGVYLYKILVKADVQGTAIKKESEYERLVILK